MSAWLTKCRIGLNLNKQYFIFNANKLMDSNRLVFAISELNALLMMIRVLPEQIQFSAEFN